MLIGDKIPIDERYYYSLLLLLQICSIVMCPSITLDTIPYLRVLIEEKVSLLPNYKYYAKDALHASLPFSNLYVWFTYKYLDHETGSQT